MRKLHAIAVVSGIALVAVLLSAVIVATPGSATGTVLLGMAPSSTDRLDSLLDIEGEIGRELDVVRTFERWDDEFGGAFHSEIENGDRIMLLSVRAKKRDGSVVPWRDIAEALPGSPIHDQMVAWVDAIEGYDGEVWFTFNHEPESSANDPMGNAVDFIDAWRAFVGLFQDRGLDNVKYNWVMTYWSFATDETEPNHADKWYPGDSYVDYISSDAYNWNFCKGGTTDPWRSLEEQIEAQRQFGLDHPDKGLALAEWASTEMAGDDGAAKAAWIEDAQALFKKPGWEQFVALSWFHVDNPDKPDCKWRIDTTAASLAAFSAMAADPFYGGPDAGGGGGGTTPPPIPPPTPPPAPPPPVDPGEVGFLDVSTSNTFYEDIVWLADEGITKGCNPPANDLFCPNSNVTRGQMAAFLVRALGYTNNGGGNLFIDDNGTTFENDIDKLATAGVTKGCNPPTNDRYCPNSNVTRSQMAAFLHRALG